MNGLLDGLNKEKVLEWERLETEMNLLASEMDKQPVKDSISLQHDLFTKYLMLSDAQNKIVRHGRKRRLKDRLIKELLDYTDAMLELKTKSITGYNRAKDNFKRLLTKKLGDIKNVKKRG